MLQVSLNLVNTTQLYAFENTQNSNFQSEWPRRSLKVIENGAIR